MAYSLVVPYGHTQLFHRHLTECELLVTATPETKERVVVQIQCCGQEYMCILPVDENGFPPQEIKKAIIKAKQVLLGQVMKEKQVMQQLGCYVH